MEKMEQEILTVKFDGQNHQIDVQTFAYSVLNFATVIKETNKKLDSGIVDIHIKAPERGSVIVQLLTTVTQNPTLLPHSVSFVADLVETVGGLYALHKFISGRKTKKPEKTDGSIKIELEDGSHMTVAEKVYNIYVGTPSISNGISQHFSALNEDPAVSKFEVSRPEGQGKLIEVDREDYARLAIKQQFDMENARTITESAHLYVYKVVFDRTDRKWEFYYNGNRISANISDDEFFASIDSGEAFAKGDQLRVDIQVNQVFDDSVGAYINQSFQVTKVYEHIKRSKPIPLPFDKKFEN